MLLFIYLIINKRAVTCFEYFLSSSVCLFVCFFLKLLNFSAFYKSSPNYSRQFLCEFLILFILLLLSSYFVCLLSSLWRAPIFGAFYSVSNIILNVIKNINFRFLFFFAMIFELGPLQNSHIKYRL